MKLFDNFFDTETPSKRTLREAKERMAEETRKQVSWWHTLGTRMLGDTPAGRFLDTNFNKVILTAGAGVVLTASLTGFVVVTSEPVQNAELKQGILSLAGEIDGTHDIDPHGANVSKDVKWSVTGTPDSYCIKAYHSKIDDGGKGSAWDTKTYDSTSGKMDSATGACSPNALKAFLHPSLTGAMDNTDIKK
jgi:hypothetical protein